MQDLELHDGNKFWRARIDGDALLVCTGKLGTEGREKPVKPTSAEGKRGNLQAELRNRAWKQLRKGFRYDAADAGAPLRWVIAAPDYMAIGDRGLSVAPSGAFAVFEQHSSGNGSRVHRVALDTGTLDTVWDGKSFLLRGVWALDDEAVLFTPTKGPGWETRLLSLQDGSSTSLAAGDHTMLGTILGADHSGRRVLVATGTMEYAVLDRGSGEELLHGAVPPTQHSQGRQFALSPDGTKLVVAAPPADGAPEGTVSTLTVFEVDGGGQQQLQTQHDTPFDALAWVGDDAFVALERFQPPQLWHVSPELVPGPSLRDVVPSNLRPMSLAGSPNGRYLAVYDGAGRLLVVDAETLTEAFSGHHALFGIRGTVEFGPGGVVLTTGGAMIGRWDTGLET